MLSDNNNNKSLLDQFVEQINARLENTRYLFVSSEAERGLGLEHLIKNYKIICLKKDEITTQLTTQNLAECIPQSAGTAQLVSSNEFKKYILSQTMVGSSFGSISTINKVYLQFFKPTLDEAPIPDNSHFNYEILNNSAKLTRQLENKVNQFNFLSQSPLAHWLPNSEINTLGALNFEELAQKYGGIVVQLPFGHTGNSTYFINTTNNNGRYQELQEIQKTYPNRACRVVDMIVGNPFTINCCLYQGQPFVAGLSYQFTGIPELTDNVAATVGNDWQLPYDLLQPDQIKEIYQLAEEMGNYLATAYQFRGFYGLDLIVEKETGKIYLIEINPRQTASVAMHTKLQLQAGEIPLAILNLAEFLNLELKIDNKQYNAATAKAISASQVFMRSKKSDDYLIPQTKLKSGVYRQQSDNTARQMTEEGKGDQVIYLDSDHDRPLIWQKEAYDVSTFGEEGFLLQLKPSGYSVDNNEEIARIQAHRSLATIFNNEVQLLPFVRDTFQIIASSVN